MTNKKHTINTLDDLQVRKDELSNEIHLKSEEIGKLWGGLFVEKKAGTRGELVASIISKSITAFDAFMLARKLVKQYGNIFTKKKK